MGVKALKFGGSSVADGIQLGKIRDIIEADPERRYVVVSAPGKRFDGDSKITDLLGGDLGTVLSRIRVVTEVSKEYTNFAGIADDMDGSVKFIYKTEEIEE